MKLRISVTVDGQTSYSIWETDGRFTLDSYEVEEWARNRVVRSLGRLAHRTAIGRGSVGAAGQHPLRAEAPTSEDTPPTAIGEEPRAIRPASLSRAALPGRDVGSDAGVAPGPRSQTLTKAAS